MRPEDYQPALTRWGHLWRFGLALVLSVLSSAPATAERLAHARWWLAGDIAIGCVCFVVVRWRRRYPVAVATFTTLAGLVSAAASGASALAMVSLATRRRWREIVPQALLAFVCGAVAQTYFPGADSSHALINTGAMAAIVGLMIAWGMYIGSRRELLASWQARAQSAEDEQAAKVQQARTAERARIAREMHDVLAHRISTVHMYAGALAYREDLPTAQVRETATVIQETSHLALTELREVLGVLREGPGDATPERPQASPADIDGLVDDNRATGMHIEYACSADLSHAPAALARTTYRCLQEALTNARKHAPSATVHVRIRGAQASGMELEVVNALPLAPTPVPGSGLGLVGLAERVELAGGRQTTRITSDDRFVLTVWLPWQA
ncbi:histidine kinase [Tsukamurella sp. 8F]|uniref:sensor histidine kinase n=1 Tax=unclassified Tsukamurella TaxID=2633480 RepID=UPI0023B88CB6|nr:MULTISPECIES: histidine kinase [unclassified Tsukamurella]MDF0530757.1 histidine kinase [Tsukamurella sp. 8J]MDF0587958.1 histidine kinase [Tsukamurella sp. 8F]